MHLSLRNRRKCDGRGRPAAPRPVAVRPGRAIDMKRVGSPPRAGTAAHRPAHSPDATKLDLTPFFTSAGSDSRAERSGTLTDFLTT